MRERVAITQADVDAAYELIAALFYDEVTEHINATAIARSFARHRIAAVKKAAKVAELWNGLTRDGDTFNIAEAIRALAD